METLKKTAGQSEEMKAQIAELQLANKTAADRHAEQISAMRLDHALEGFLRDSKAKNPKAVRALLDMNVIKLDGDTLLGADDQIKALRKSDAYLFADTETIPGVPNPPPPPPKGNLSIGEKLSALINHGV